MNMRETRFYKSGVDCDLLCSFVLSVLWRASISSRPECTVSLGLYEDEARDVLFGLKPLSGFDAFQVLVQRYRSTGIDVDRFYTLPVLAPFETLNAYGLSLLGYRITCKIIQGRCLTIVLHLLSMASRLYKVLLSISSRRRNLAEQ